MKKWILTFILISSFNFLRSEESDTLWTRELGGNGKGDIINAIFSPDDNSIFVTTTERFYEVSTATGTIIREIPEIRGMLKFVQDNKFFISYDYKKYSYPAMIMVEDFQESLKIGALNSYDFDKDCSRMAIVKAKQYPDFDSSVVIYEINTGKSLYSFKTNENYVNIKFSPDCRYFTTVSGDLGDITTQEDNQSVFRLWDAVNFKELKVLHKENSKTAYLNFIGFSPDSKYLGYVNSTQLYLYNTETWQLVDTFKLVGKETIDCFTFSNNSENIYLIGNGYSIHVYNIVSHELIKLIGPKWGSAGLQISKNNNYIVGFGGSYLILWPNTITDVTEPKLTDNIFYPNPVKNILTIQNTFGFIKKAMISDIRGSIINNSLKYSESKDALEFDFSKLVTGTYILTLITDNQTISIKFIKE